MYAIDRYEDFTDMEQNAIELLYTLWQTKASLGTLEDIMKWHLSTLRRTSHIRGNFENNIIINPNTLCTELFER
jgi:hypothetical protein